MNYTLITFVVLYLVGTLAIVIALLAAGLLLR